ncbi:MAG: oligosaccharide flippase family protein [Candidatus Eisenbacteria bacterium]|nr:oligosaccharide flippase family protein [Candidatus Eisenbacteria bacterium]
MKSGEIARSVSRGAFYLAIEKVAALVSGTMYFALLLRWLGPTKYGIMTLALSFAGLATMATGNFETYLERFAAEYQARGALRTLRRAHLLALGFKLALGAVAGALLLVISPVLAGQFHTPDLAMLLPLLTLMVVFDGFSTTGRAALYGMQRFGWVCLLAVVFHVLKTLMVGLLWFTRQGLAALAVGLTVLTVVQGIVSTLVLLWLLRRGDNRADEPEAGPRELMRSITAYCLPLLGARITFLSGQNLGKVVLGKLFDSAQLGYFSFAFQTLERFIELAHTLPSSLLPSLTHLVAREERQRLRNVFDQAFRLIQVAACVLSFGVFVFARELTLLVGSPLFLPAVPLLRVMALVPIARTAQQPLTMLFQAMRRPGTVLTLALIKFGTEFSCYFALVPTVGMMGAGWANLAGAVVSYIAALVLLSRMVREGAADRARAALTAIAVTVPLLVAGLLLDRPPIFGWSFAARLALVPLGVFALFALQLVTGYDLEKLSSLPVQGAWLRRSRDGLVAAAGRLVPSSEPRGAE